MSARDSNPTALEDRPKAPTLPLEQVVLVPEPLPSEKSGALHLEDSLEMAGQCMRAHHADEWPVMEHHKLVGMVEEQDPDWQAGGHGHDPKTMTVGDIMSSDLVFCFEDEDCSSALNRMDTRGLTHVPVVDRQMRILGIFSRAEVGEAAARFPQPNPLGRHITTVLPSNQNGARADGMGAIRLERGYAFRVWAPHAEAVFVSGNFNSWSPDAHPMTAEGNGNWYAEVPAAGPGHEYEYVLHHGGEVLHRKDPRARTVTNSAGKSVIYHSTFDWGDDHFKMPPWNELVIYELHIGTFAQPDPARPGTFDDAIQRLPYLQWLGVNAVEVMPVSEFAGDFSWGYNPCDVFAVETIYGGPEGFKRFIQAAHRLGIAVILDVVYNHFGPSDLDLWRFDGWSENDKGGIYFYNDSRSQTPWGETRPDYGREEVRRFIFDNAMMWLSDFRVDGLRYDMSVFIRTISGGDDAIPDGWSLMQWMNREIEARFPGRLTIAEDLRDNDLVTRPDREGGANFGAQWDAHFVHSMRRVITEVEDQNRDMEQVRSALLHRFNLDVHDRVIYTESHDEVANGQSRVVSEIAPDDPAGWYALKRSTLGIGLVLTSPGIPMLFQGQTILEPGWFHDTHPIDWENSQRFPGVGRLYRDLIRLRRNLDGDSRGLTGSHVTVHHVNHGGKVVGYHRRYEGGPKDHCMMVANFSMQSFGDYRIGFPVAGRWRCRFNSDWNGYREDLGNFAADDVVAEVSPYDGEPAAASIRVGAYSLLIFTLAEA